MNPGFVPPVPQPGSELMAHIRSLVGIVEKRDAATGHVCIQVPRPEPEHTLTLDYVLTEGGSTLRRVTALKLYYGTTPAHVEEQLLLDAVDIEQSIVRTFVVSGIKRWVPRWWANHGPYAHPAMSLPKKETSSE